MKRFTSGVRVLHTTNVKMYTKTINSPSTGRRVQGLERLLSPSICLFIGTVRKLQGPLSRRSVHFFNRVSGLFSCSQEGTGTYLRNYIKNERALFVSQGKSVCTYPEDKVQVKGFCSSSASSFRPFYLHGIYSYCVTFDGLYSAPLEEVVKSKTL